MDNIRIYDVTARDGLQNEKDIVRTADKRKIIEHLIEAGHQDIEVTSFVKPSWIPQLADSEALVRLLASCSRRRSVLGSYSQSKRT